ncbi:MAG TPA: MFS transporter, partial [Bdellovibrionota bacterium]|nr:MFS transporter [Bdellovibrionota bacterium]
MLYRWVVLILFALQAGLSQFLWINYAPLLSKVQSLYGVSESQAGLLMLVFPFVYMVLSVPAGVLIDRKGYVFSVGLGSILMAAFACLRLVEGGYWLLFVAQTGISIGQPFVVNGVSKLVLDWFPQEQDALANGVGTMGMFIGMATAMASTPAMVSAWGLSATMA